MSRWWNEGNSLKPFSKHFNTVPSRLLKRVKQRLKRSKVNILRRLSLRNFPPFSNKFRFLKVKNQHSTVLFKPYNIIFNPNDLREPSLLKPAHVSWKIRSFILWHLLSSINPILNSHLYPSKSRFSSCIVLSDFHIFTVSFSSFASNLLLQ